MSRKDHEEFGDMILLHEHAHLRQQHSIDIVIAYSTICLQWYNPAAWAIRDELKAVHEYQEDEMVMSTGADRTEQAEYELFIHNSKGLWTERQKANIVHYQKRYTIYQSSYAVGFNEFAQTKTY